MNSACRLFVLSLGHDAKWASLLCLRPLSYSFLNVWISFQHFILCAFDVKMYLWEFLSREASLQPLLLGQLHPFHHNHFLHLCLQVSLAASFRVSYVVAASAFLCWMLFQLVPAISLTSWMFLHILLHFASSFMFTSCLYFPVCQSLLMWPIFVERCMDLSWGDEEVTLS